MKSIGGLANNDGFLEELSGSSSEVKFSYPPRKVNLKKLEEIFEPYIKKIVLVQHFGNKDYARFGYLNKGFRGDLEKIPRLSFPLIESIGNADDEGRIKLFFKNNSYGETCYFSIPYDGSSNINNLGVVARIVDSERKVLFEDSKQVGEWNKSFSDYRKNWGKYYEDVLVAYGLGRFWSGDDDPVST